MVKIIYKTRATATGGRSGHSQPDDGSLGFDLAMPGSGKAGANPEQLFAIGYAACFDSALALTARQMKKAITGCRTSAEVGLAQAGEGGYGLDIDLCIEVQGLPEAEARELVEATHRICPYSNGTRGNIDVRLHVTVPRLPLPATLSGTTDDERHQQSARAGHRVLGSQIAHQTRTKASSSRSAGIASIQEEEKREIEQRSTYTDEKSGAVRHFKVNASTLRSGAEAHALASI